jgi:hypothetical protein
MGLHLRIDSHDGVYRCQRNGTISKHYLCSCGNNKDWLVPSCKRNAETRSYQESHRYSISRAKKDHEITML